MINRQFQLKANGNAIYEESSLLKAAQIRDLLTPFLAQHPDYEFFLPPGQDRVLVLKRKDKERETALKLESISKEMIDSYNSYVKAQNQTSGSQTNQRLFVNEIPKQQKSTVNKPTDQLRMGGKNSPIQKKPTAKKANPATAKRMLQDVLDNNTNARRSDTPTHMENSSGSRDQQPTVTQQVPPSTTIQQQPTQPPRMTVQQQHPQDTRTQEEREIDSWLNLEDDYDSSTGNKP